MGICASNHQSALNSSETGHSSATTAKKAPPRKTLVDRLPKVLKREDSLDSQDARVVAKQTKWMNRQASKMQSNDASDWANVFDSMCQELNKQELTIQELDLLFKRLGSKINKPMLHLIFNLFDADASGTVSKTEFLVAITFLSEAENTKDIIDLAFYLFDTNRSGTVNKAEFSRMCYALMNRAKFVLGAPFLRAAFRKHLESEHAEENLDLYEQWEKLRKITQPVKYASQRTIHMEGRRRSTLTPEIVQDEKAIFTLGDARVMYRDFISVSAARQVNLSDANRKCVETCLQAVDSQPDSDTIDSHAFDQCIAELIKLMETDSMTRFKEKIHTNETWLADQVWNSENIKSDSLSKAHFRKWAQRNPHMFSFLHELQITLRRALYRQKFMAAVKIQRAYRARIRKRMIQLVHEAAGKLASPH